VSATARLLIVSKDDALRRVLANALVAGGGYSVASAGTFEQALQIVMAHRVDMVITEVNLPDLSGMDLLAVIGNTRPGIGVIIVDSALTARRAVAAFRLGALDYIYRPLNMTLFMMLIERHIADLRDARVHQRDPRQTAQMPAALTLDQETFKRVNAVLNKARTVTSAHFLGLLDQDSNMLGASGSLNDTELSLLMRALSVCARDGQAIAPGRFEAIYLESDGIATYLVAFNHPVPLALVAFCPARQPQQAVWAVVKRAAAIVSGYFAPAVRSTAEVPASPGAPVKANPQQGG
jgi:DNA-binding response OmpR family regulator